jgi:nucleotide-binding universal stress UspA family protein
MYKTIIWATDGSEGANRALQEALQLSKISGARIVAVHADQRLQGRAGDWPLLADEDDLRLEIRRQVDALKREGIDIELVVRPGHQNAAHIVAAVAEELKGDVIVCGTRGLGALSGAFLGSFTKHLLHIAPCPVLAVRKSKPVVTAPGREKAQIGV